MDPLMRLVYWLDPVLIAPYRWLNDPILGWWLGTMVLGIWCTLFGELTLGLVYRLNWRQVRVNAVEMTKYHNQAMEALKAGDKDGYKALNKQANDAFGKTFFQRMAMGMGSLWPLFTAAAWLQERFQGTNLAPGWMPWELNWVAGFVTCYLLVRIAFGRVKKHLPFFRQSLVLAKRLSPEERMDMLSIPPDELKQG